MRSVLQVRRAAERTEERREQPTTPTLPFGPTALGTVGCREELEHDLREVLSGAARPKFCLQPIADLGRAAVAGYEALVRLPVRAALPPDVCLRAAARMGVQVELEAIIAREALALRSLLPGNTFLSFNVSPAFLASAAWDELLQLQEHLHRMVVEITEEQSIVDYEVIRGRVADIRAKGGMIAIDDAGAGYASLNHILELRPAFIKLDRNFVAHCDVDRAKSAMIEMMGAAASRMDAWIIAEGVETPAELAELLRLNVPLAQGFFLGRPLPEIAGLTAAAREELETKAVRRAQDAELLLLSEDCPSAGSRAEAHKLLQHRACDLVVVTNQWGRPVETLERDRSVGVRIWSAPMVCQVTSRLVETLERALTRPQAERFQPLVLIDNEGRLHGIARVDRLMQTVLGKQRAKKKKPPSRAGASDRALC